MKKLSDIKPILSFTFQKTTIVPIQTKEDNKNTNVAVKFNQTDDATPYCFYRPISKIITI